MKTLILPIPMGHLVKNILRTGVFRHLKESGIQIVILTFESDNEEFVREFKDQNVIIEKLAKHKSSFWEVLAGGIADRIYRNRIKNETLEILDKARLRDKKLLNFLKIRVIGKLVGKSTWLMNVMEHIYMKGFNDQDYGDLFEKYAPDLYFSTDPYNVDELPLLRRCLRNKVPIVAMIRSWDNITNHGKLPMRFERIIVWNELLRDELIKFYGYSPGNIYISGTPQYDYYYDYKTSPRREFFQRIGGDPDKKLITFATVPPLISSNEQDNVEMLCESLRNNEIKYPVQLLIRIHPQDEPERYKKLDRYRNDGDVIIESAGQKSSAYFDKWSPTERDMLHYADILSHSDVIINVSSTVSIEAAIFDTPVINVAYDGRQKRDYYESAARNYDFLHYRNILKTGGVKLVRSHEELVSYINQYLGDKSLDRAARKKLVEQQCYRLDGKAGERIARYVLQRIGAGLYNGTLVYLQEERTYND